MATLQERLDKFKNGNVNIQQSAATEKDLLQERLDNFKNRAGNVQSSPKTYTPASNHVAESGTSAKSATSIVPVIDRQEAYKPSNLLDMTDDELSVREDALQQLVNSNRFRSQELNRGTDAAARQAEENLKALQEARGLKRLGAYSDEELRGMSLADIDETVRQLNEQLKYAKDNQMDAQALEYQSQIDALQGARGQRLQGKAQSYDDFTAEELQERLANLERQQNALYQKSTSTGDGRYYQDATRMGYQKEELQQANYLAKVREIDEDTMQMALDAIRKQMELADLMQQEGTYRDVNPWFAVNFGTPSEEQGSAYENIKALSAEADAALQAAKAKAHNTGADWTTLEHYAESQINKERADAMTENAKNTVEDADSIIGAMLRHSGSQIFGGLGALDMTAQAIGNAFRGSENYLPIDPNTNYNRYSILADAYQQGGAELVEKYAAADPILGKFLTGKDYITGDQSRAQYLYNVGVSSLDSAVNLGVAMLLSAGISGFVPMDAQTFNTTSARLVNAIMGSSAATSAIRENLKSGDMTDAQAVTLGIMSGVAEAITESWSIETLLNGDTTAFARLVNRIVKNPVGNNLLKGFISEGSEEIASNWLNRLFDYIVRHDKSETMQDYNAYLSQGDSSGEAWRKIFAGWLQEDASAGLAGSLAGLTGGASHYALTGTVDSVDTYVTEREAEKARLQAEQNARQEAQNVEQNAQQNTAQNVQQMQKKTAEQPTAQNVQQNTAEQQRAENTQQERPAANNTEAQITNRNRSEAEVDSDILQVARAATVFGESGAKALTDAYDRATARQISPEEAVTGFTHIYNAALENKDIPSENLPAHMRMAAEYAGQNDAARAAQAKYFGESAMLVRDKAFKKAHLSSRTAMRLDALAKVLGVKIRFAEEVNNGLSNAAYGDGEMVIALDTQDPLNTAVIHEAIHRLRETNPKLYNELSTFIQTNLSTDRYLRSILERMDRYQNSDLGYLTEEMVADAFGRIMNDGKLLDRYVQDNRTGAEKLRDLLQDIVNAVRRVLNQQNLKLSREQKAEFQELEKQYSAMAQKLTKALDAAARQTAEQIKRTDNSNPTSNPDIRYSLKEDIEKQINSAGLYLQNKDNNKNNLRIRAYLSEAYPDYSIGFQNDKNTGRVSVLSVADRKTAQDAFARSAAETAHRMKEVNEKKRFYDRVKTPSGIERLRLSLMKRLERDGYTSAYIETSKSSVHSISSYIYAVSEDGNPVTIKISDHNTMGQKLGNNTDAFIDLRDMRNIDHVYKEIQAIFERNGVLQSADNAGKYSLKAGTKPYVSDLARFRYSLKQFENVNIEYDAESESAYPGKFSMKTWNESEYAKDKAAAAHALSEALNVSLQTAQKYIDNVNSVAKMIADDRVRLDYESSPGQSSFVSNTEYGGSIDFSTICKKRRLVTGTFEAIQNALPNTALSADDILTIRNMMKERGYEVNCGLCYVEGSRTNMGQYTKEFLDEYAKTNPKYLPNMAEMNTATGQEKIRIEHPEVYKAYEQYMNKLAQRKPKLYQMATEYQGEILNKFRNAKNISEKNKNGGMRLQSFSDFEIIHLIDCMQVIMDMSRVGLAGQAYTKVSDFAWALGDTGMKINLSLISKGVDSRGNLILDEVEGMKRSDAEALRNRYPENVGTIVVVFTDRQLAAAMKDPFIDFIIPFHRSQTNKSQYDAMGLPENTKDFTAWQNEAYITPVLNKNGKKQRPANYMPNEYWDFSKSGKENAEAYLKMCAENNRRPKFHYILDENADGSYSLKKDGSTDGYWKLLIDFKMYDNDGKGAPQHPVVPNFNMDEAERMLKEYKGGHSKFPAAKDVVDDFVSQYKSQHAGIRYSLKQFDDGKRFVDVETDQAQFDGLSLNEMNMLAHKIIKQKYGNKVVGIDNRVYVNGNSAEEYVYFKRGTPKEVIEAKARASTELDNLIDAGTNFRTAEDGADGHVHPDAPGGFSYFDTIFKVGPEYYKGVVNVKNNGRGKLFWGVTKTENITQDIYASYGKNPTSTFLRDASMETVTQEKESVKRKKSKEEIPTEELLAELVKRYGAMPTGENPFRDIVLPKKTAKELKLSQTVRTILEAKTTPEVMVPSIQELAADGTYSYQSYSDEAALSDAEAKIRDVGWGKALEDWNKAVRSGEVSKANTAMGWALYDHSANSGDTATALMVLNNMVEHQRSAAQAVQATRILKQMNPETQLYGVQRSVANLQKEINERYGKKGVKLIINEDLAERFMKAETQTERDNVLADIYRDIGRQMPSSFMDKWNAWRYLSMLGNPRTHVRNIVGNAGFVPVVAVKNLTATGIEAAVNFVSGGQLQRTKGLIGFSSNDRAILKAAWNDYAKIEEAAMGGGKYSDYAAANKYVEEGRRIFRLKGLEWLRKTNGKLLDQEDVWFSQPHYANALAQYCKANHIAAEQIAEGGTAIKNARAYAILEAQKATYRDTNAFSQAISDLGRVGFRTETTVNKAIAKIIEGILPFRKTPANILVRGIEYSPIGLMWSIKQGLVDVKSGKKTGAQVIDGISAGLTGTGLAALGFYLASQLLVRGGGGDDDKKKNFEDLTGHQTYSLELPDGTSITLDWLAPECMPFFIGVNLYEMMRDNQGNLTMADMLSAITQVSEPLMELSCLQSLNSVFEAVGSLNNSGVAGLPKALINAATSYFTQGLPTVLGQVERTFENQRYTTYTEKNAFLTGDMQYAFGKAGARIPGVDFQQIPYIDAWGRIEYTGDLPTRALNNFLNPAYTSKITTSDAEKELLRLYEATGDASVLPQRAPKYFTVDSERKDLTAEEYVKYATLKGQKSLELVTNLTKSDAYKKLNDEQKVDAIANAYKLANQIAKTKISSYKPEAWVQKAIDAEKSTGVKMEAFLIAKAKTADLESIKDKNGDSITNSKGLLIMQQIYSIPGLTDKQRAALFESLGVGKEIRHLNKAAVDEKLQRIEKKNKK